MKNYIFAISILAIGLVAGLGFGESGFGQLSQAQEVEKDKDKILIRGHGRAVTELDPPGEQFTLINPDDPHRPFRAVPSGKKFILTDVMYNPQLSVREPITVNITNANPVTKTHEILFQVRLEPGKSDQVHLCSGYEISSGRILTASTGRGPATGQFVSIAVTGYLVDEPSK